MFKFSGFSPRANAAINSAMSEASLLGHSFVGTEHLLWGILREGNCEEYKSLSECKIDCEKVLGRPQATKRKIAGVTGDPQSRQRRRSKAE